MSVPGHKQRHDLIGAVTAGDVPLYGGLDRIKHADRLLPRPSAARPGCGARTCAGSRWAARRTATRPWRSPSARPGRPGRGDPHAAPLDAARPGAGRPGTGVGAPGGRPGHRAPGSGHRRRASRPPWPRAPDARAVFVGDPSYVGTVGDVGGLATVAHAAGIPLVVDAAWGAHLGFHPALPPHALAAGADALVTSAHKALPAWSQGALVLARTAGSDGPASTPPSRRPPQPARRARSWPASTPPVRCSQRDGEALLGPVIEAVRGPRGGCAGVPGLVVLDGPGVDPMRLDPGAARHGRRRQRGRGRPPRPRDAGRDGRPRHRRRDGDPRRHRRGARRPRSPSWSRSTGTGASPGRSCTSGVWAGRPGHGTPARGRPSSRRTRASPSSRPSAGSVPSWSRRTRRASRCSRRARRSPSTASTRCGRPLADGGRIAYAADPTVHTLDVIAR